MKLALALALLAGIVSMAHAGVVVVPTDQPTIADALAAVSAGDSILVECGTYSEFGLTMVSDVVLRSTTGEPGCVTLDPGGNVALQWSSCGPGTRVEGITFTNGFTPLSIHDSSGSVASCVFVGNGGVYGGGMEAWSSSIEVTDCIFDSNTPGGDGAISAYSSTLVVDGCDFLDNQAFEGAGAIWLGAGSSLSVTDSRFERNQASEGGAIVSISSLPVTLDGCEFIDNEAIDAFGGALSASGDVEVRGCRFEGNSAKGAGAILVSSGATLLAEDDVFLANTAASYGGAIQCSGIATVRRSTLVANRAELYGAAIAARFGGSLDVEHTVIAFASLGGGVYCDGVSSVTASCTDVYGNLGGDWVGCLETQLVGSGNLHVDPLFCDLLSGDLTVAANSTLLAANNPCGEAIGALGQSCAGQITAVDAGVPSVPWLGPAWPNPFNPRATVPFSLSSASPVRLTAYDARGRQVAVLVDEFLPAGSHEAVFEAVDPRGEPLASGVYFAQLQTAQTTLTTRLVLIR